MNIVIYTDGAFSSTLCQGTFGFVAYPKGNRDLRVERKGPVIHHRQTSQVAELTAFIKSLEFVFEELCKGDKSKSLKFNLHILSDSSYLVNGSMDWMYKWKRNNWKDKENIDLWKRIYDLKENHFGEVKVEWVKGHNGNPMNELADALCGEAMSEFKDKRAKEQCLI